MKRNLNYSFKLSQIQNETCEHIESENIITIIDTLPNTELVKDLILYDNILGTDQPIYINKDICGEYIDNKSVPSSTVPDTSKARFLVKKGVDYNYIKDKPLVDIEIDPFFYLNLQGKQYNSVELGDYHFRDHVAIQLQSKFNLSESENYTCYSFNFGGLSKANSYFFYVDSFNVIQLINPDDERVIIDYVEGFIYLNNSIFDVRIVCGLFNVEPILVIPKGNFKLDTKINSFYKVANISEKQIIDIKYIENGVAIIRPLVNCFISIPSGLESNSLMIDGVLVERDQYIHIKKNSLVTIKIYLGEDPSLNHEYLNVYNNIVNESANNTSPTFTSINESNNLPNSEQESNFIISVLVELEKNTYNKEFPIILKLFT